jgi:hypothetical protein
MLQYTVYCGTCEAGHTVEFCQVMMRVIIYPFDCPCGAAHFLLAPRIGGTTIRTCKLCSGKSTTMRRHQHDNSNTCTQKTGYSTHTANSFLDAHSQQALWHRHQNQDQTNTPPPPCACQSCDSTHLPRQHSELPSSHCLLQIPWHPLVVLVPCQHMHRVHTQA